MRDNKGQFIDGQAGKDTRFTRERLLGNQYAKGNKPNKTSFTTVNTLERHASWKGGIQKTKRDGYYIAYATKKRMPLARWKWQQVNGEIPKNYVVIHKNGDRYDDGIGNLEAITRAENLQRNQR